MAKNGATVAALEKEFASYVGAKYAIALCNGTATLHTALVALGVKQGDRVAVPPLTMSATTIAVLQAGAVPVFCDVDEKTWLMKSHEPDVMFAMPVDLYGLTMPHGWLAYRNAQPYKYVYDSAQTLRTRHRYDGGLGAAFTSYSFQASKLLALGEGGMLVTDSEELATKAREFSSLGYRMRADQPRIDPATLKSPDYARHYTMGWNYRMNDLTAEQGLKKLAIADNLKRERRECAALYAQAIEGYDWLTPQHVPEGFTHDYWAYAVKIEDPKNIEIRGRTIRTARWEVFAALIEKHGGERPYAAWRLTYHEPAFAHLKASCPVAEDLQPRLMQMQTNDLKSAERNAKALRKAIQEIGN